MKALRQTAEYKRLLDSRTRQADWKNWGPYVSDRAWGTVREDYSHDARPWDYFPFDNAHKRAFRWNEDGIGGFCNRMQNLCTTVAIWNGRDDRLKERFFGVSGEEGNHGEDVKEYYFYQDGLPSHAYMRMLYRYPQSEFPYADLVNVSTRRRRSEPEYELVDALPQDLADRRYFDVVIEYAKVSDDDFVCRITALNRGPDPDTIHILPHVLFRNTWSWGYGRPVPALTQDEDCSGDGSAAVRVTHQHLGTGWWYVREASGEPVDLYFTDNESNPSETNLEEGVALSGFFKDGINRRVVHGDYEAVNHNRVGTKAAGHVVRRLEPDQSCVVYFRFSPHRVESPFDDVEDLFVRRIRETDEYYEQLQPRGLTDDQRYIHRQASAGLLWSKQFYHYSVQLWLDGDPAGPRLPEWRKHGRNSNWRHLYNLDVLSMPDKWEYPWYAAWDLAFHLIPLSALDPEWAKRQAELLLREWYMHPNGQLPAYEWEFSDVNPPVHAFAALQIYRRCAELEGSPDRPFLARLFHKLLLNFTWWVNQKDVNGNNVFEGGFLGLDNIGVLNRSMQFPPGVLLEQADGTAWMALYCLNMLEIALELAVDDQTYEDVATKFFEHFVYISHAINLPVAESGLWNDEDGFYYDRLHHPDGSSYTMRIRSFVGLVSLFAVGSISRETLDALPRFEKRVKWFLQYRPGLVGNAVRVDRATGNVHLSLVSEERLRRILVRLSDPEQFLSDFGLRSMSREHLGHPFAIDLAGQRHTVRYEPAESASPLYGGNSNWRGPVWMPLNFLMIESLKRHYNHFGDSFSIETTNLRRMNLREFADDLSARLQRIFLKTNEGHRPFYGGVDLFQNDDLWNDNLLFYEYFHGDNGAGIGASHQTGWTALIATLIQDSSR